MVRSFISTFESEVIKNIRPLLLSCELKPTLNPLPFITRFVTPDIVNAVAVDPPGASSMSLSRLIVRLLAIAASKSASFVTSTMVVGKGVGSGVFVGNGVLVGSGDGLNVGSGVGKTDPEGRGVGNGEGNGEGCEGSSVGAGELDGPRVGNSEYEGSSEGNGDGSGVGVHVASPC